MQHKTIYNSRLKQILKNIRGFASREKFSVQESSNFLPLCQTRKVLFIFMIAQILFLCWLVLSGTGVVDRYDNDAIIEKPGLKSSNVVSE